MSSSSESPDKRTGFVRGERVHLYRAHGTAVNMNPDNPGLMGHHSLLWSVALHLVPGALSLIAYLWICEPIAVAWDLPRQFGFALKVVFGVLPVQLGWLLYLGWKSNGRLSLEGVLSYRKRLPARRMILWVTGLVGWALVVIALFSWVDELLFEKVFSWIPGSLLPEADLLQYSPRTLLGTWAVSLLLIGLVAPIVEELYFRAYLLPRVSWMGRWAPVWGTVFFNAYHFMSPWRIVTRCLFTLPMVYAVKRTQSVYVGIWWHCIGNVLGELATLVGIAKLLRSSI